MALLNTHATVKKFIQHGFSEEQAEVVVDAINDQSNQLATKGDLSALKTELKSEIINLEIRLDSVKSSVSLLTTISIANLTVVVGGMLALLLPLVAKLF
jgi:predicted component of type VI protein secretion system